MTEYNVISSATKYNPVCVLTVVLEDGTMDSFEIKGWKKENGDPLIGTSIIIETTNREIIPSDVKMTLAYPEQPPVG